MVLIAGLGNPGEAYRNTRHNIGFEVIDRLVTRHGGSFKTGAGSYSLAHIMLSGQKVALIKPTTFMNLSGRAVRHAMSYYEIVPTDLLVVTDDIHLDTAVLRLRKDGSAGGHNGMLDIVAHLGTTSFPRLRFGVGNNFRPGTQADFVLSKFGASEKESVDAGIERAADAVECFCNEGIVTAMNRFNSKPNT